MSVWFKGVQSVPSPPNQIGLANHFFVDQNFTGVSTGSPTAPFKTLFDAFSAAVGGEVIILASGNYMEGGLPSISGGYVIKSNVDFQVSIQPCLGGVMIDNVGLNFTFIGDILSYDGLGGGIRNSNFITSGNNIGNQIRVTINIVSNSGSFWLFVGSQGVINSNDIEITQSSGEFTHVFVSDGTDPNEIFFQNSGTSGSDLSAMWSIEIISVENVSGIVNLHDSNTQISSFEGVKLINSMVGDDTGTTGTISMTLNNCVMLGSQFKGELNIAKSIILNCDLESNEPTSFFEKSTLITSNIHLNENLIISNCDLSIDLLITSTSGVASVSSSNNRVLDQTNILDAGGNVNVDPQYVADPTNFEFLINSNSGLIGQSQDSKTIGAFGVGELIDLSSPDENNNISVGANIEVLTGNFGNIKPQFMVLDQTRNSPLISNNGINDFENDIPDSFLRGDIPKGTTIEITYRETIGGSDEIGFFLYGFRMLKDNSGRNSGDDLFDVYDISSTGSLDNPDNLSPANLIPVAEIKPNFVLSNRYDFLNGLIFDEVDSRGNITNLQSSGAFPSVFTFACWVKILQDPSNTDPKVIFSNADSTNTDNDFRVFTRQNAVPAGQIEISAITVDPSNATRIMTHNTAFTVNEKFFVCVTLDGLGDGRLYVNGQLVDTELAWAFMPSNWNDRINYGCFNNAFFFADTQNGESWWLDNKALTEKEIFRMYNGGYGMDLGMADYLEILDYSNILFHHKFDESVPSIVASDSSTNGNDVDLLNFGGTYFDVF